MANTLKIKRGLAAGIPQGQLAEPLFTTDTYDLYIGKGSGGNQRFQKYIASGTSSQFLKGDGSLDSTTYQTALTFSSPLVNTSGTVSIPVATGSVDGYLSSTDWTTFNSKEPAITAGTSTQYYRGDKTFQTLNTAAVPESGAVYFTEPRVLATVLTGLNLTGGGTIAATDSVLQAFGKVQNQISALVGGATYQGVWNASTNTPTLASGTGTKGYYYVVSVAGSTNLDGITDWKIGDWAIFNGTTWDKVDNTDAVSSVNGFTGAVNLALDNISDVDAASPTNAQLLRFNGTSSKWENWTPTYISAAITSLNGLTVATQTFADDTNVTITSAGTVHTLGWSGNLAVGRGGTGITTYTLGDILYSSAANVLSKLAGNTTTTKKFLNQTGDGTVSAAPVWSALVSGDIPNNAADTSGNAATATKLATARTLTIGATGKTFDGSANVSWTLADIGAQATLTNPVTGTGTAAQIAYFSNTSQITGSSTFTFSPTSTFSISNTATAGSGQAVAMNIIPNVNAAANDDILYGVRISPTFSNGVFTGVTQRALGVFGNVYINGTITSGTWNGTVIGATYGGAGTVSGILKANGSGTVSAAVAGTDFQAVLTNPVTGTGTTGQLTYFNGTTTVTGSSTLTYTPTSTLNLNNSVSPSASPSAKGMNITSSLTATANNDLLVGLDVFPSFTNGAFTGVTNYALRVIGPVLLSGATTLSGALSGTSATFSSSVNATNGLLIGNGGATATTNYLPKFTGASTIGNSIIQDASTYIEVAGYALLRRGGKNLIVNPNYSILNLYAEIATDTGMDLSLSTNGTTKQLYLNTSGNLGLGVTPSAWGSGTFGFDIGSGSAIYNPGSGNQTQILNNSYNNGTNFIFKNSSAAARYRMIGAAHEWYSADSGTAGNAITFTQAMTLDASGRLGIGTSSVPIGVSIFRPTTTQGDTKTNLLVFDTTSYATGVGGGISLGGYYDSSSNEAYTFGYIKGAKENATNGDYASYLSFGTRANGGSPTERMRITSGGNVGIGCTPNYGKLEIQGATTDKRLYVGTAAFYSNSIDILGISSIGGEIAVGISGSELQFWTNATKRMTITNGGNIEATGSIKTGAPTSGTAKPWKLGSRIVGTCTTSTTAYLEVDVDGTLYYLAFANPS
jgi:hypothetical protein